MIPAASESRQGHATSTCVSVRRSLWPVSSQSSIRATFSSSLKLSRDRLRRAPRHIVLTWVLQGLVLLALGHLLPGVLVEDPLSALLAAAVIAGLNALVRPIVVMLTLPLTVATFGLLSLLINTSIIVLAAPLVPGMEVSGFLPALSLAVILTVVTTIINVALAVDEDETFYAELARRMASGSAPVEGPTLPGLVMIQIDGLAAPILRNAIRVGLVPRMASWVRSDAYTLSEWECPPPSQTSASQAGILFGKNDDIPAFRWYEKESGRLLVSTHPADAAEIERRMSDGAGLLHPSGTSVGNLFSGDAKRNALVMSKMGDQVGQLDVDAFSLYFVDPAAFIRTIVLSVGEFIKELIEARRQRVNDIQPRVHRGLTSAFLRAATNVVLRDLNTTFVVRSMSLGVPTIYVDFTDYDEIAHHAGPERLESLRALTGVDRVVASLERAAKDAPRDYRFVLLSDHGQSQGATFLQRHGQTLEGLIADLMGADTSVTAATGRGETFGPVNALLTDLAQRPGMTGKATRAAFRGSSIDGTVELGDDAERAPEPDADLVVCASGNLANVYFTASQERLRVAEIDRLYPGLMASLAEHPGIGFVMARSAKGTVVLGSGGVRYLDDDRVEGEDPLALFGGRAADHLRRLDSFPHVGDLLINSSYDPELGEVAAFEELVGSHGGMGGPQTQPFLLHPADLTMDDDPLVGAPAVHRQLRRWSEELGVEADVLRTTEAVPEEMPEPRGLGWVAAWLMLTGALAFLAAFGVLVADLMGQAGEEFGEAPLIVAATLAVIGLVGLAAGVGIWRRRRWAWMTALVLQGFNVLQLIMAVASGGFSGLITIGFIPAVMALLVFYYLTRPHVAAVFGRS